jgi:hypothetical protein
MRWPAQEAVENAVTLALNRFGCQAKRARPVRSEKGHGFIDSQRYGIDAFRRIPSRAPVIVVEAVCFETQIEKRMSHGIEVQGSYTWSRAIDGGDGAIASDSFLNSIPQLVVLSSKISPRCCRL